MSLCRKSEWVMWYSTSAYVNFWPITLNIESTDRSRRGGSGYKNIHSSAGCPYRVLLLFIIYCAITDLHEASVLRPLSTAPSTVIYNKWSTECFVKQWFLIILFYSSSSLGDGCMKCWMISCSDPRVHSVVINDRRSELWDVQECKSALSKCRRVTRSNKNIIREILYEVIVVIICSSWTAVAETAKCRKETFQRWVHWSTSIFWRVHSSGDGSWELDEADKRWEAGLAPSSSWPA